MANITHLIGVKADPETVLQALTTIPGLSNWWTETTSGSAEQGGRIEFKFNNDILAMKVTNVSNNKIAWECVSGPEEWLGTPITFELQTGDKQTMIFFSHKNWQTESPFHYHCSMKWAVFLLSLKNYLDTGKGNAFPNDIAIDQT